MVRFPTVIFVDFYYPVTFVGGSPVAAKVPVEEIGLLSVHFGTVLVVIVAVENGFYIGRVFK